MSDADLQTKIFQKVSKERIRQQRLHGRLPRNLNPSLWLTVLTEEVGEVARAMIEANAEQYEQELVEVAATAISALADFYGGPSTQSLEDVCGRMVPQELEEKALTPGCECGECTDQYSFQCESCHEWVAYCQGASSDELCNECWSLSQSLA